MIEVVTQTFGEKTSRDPGQAQGAVPTGRFAFG